MTSRFWENSSSDEQALFDLLMGTLQKGQALLPKASLATFVFASVVYPVVAFAFAVVSVDRPNNAVVAGREHAFMRQ